MRARLHTLLIGLVLLIAGAAYADDLIVPGQRVNGFVIGKTSLDEIKKALGDFKSDWEEKRMLLGAEAYVKMYGEGDKVIEYPKYGMTLSVSVRALTLKQIDLGKPNYQTQEGIRVGTRALEILKAWGPPDSNAGDYAYFYYRKGITFSLDGHKVVKILVYKPSVK